MCIEKVSAYKVDGVYYEDERDAVEAKLKKIGQRLMKEYSADPMQGLIDMRDDLLPMLELHRSHFPPDAVATEVASEKATGEPMKAPRGRLVDGHQKHCGFHTGFACDCGAES